MTKFTFQRRYLGVTAILSLMALTLYFAFAFPIDLFKMRQSDTTIIKSVQILVRHGDKAPTPASYFLGEKEGLVEPLDGFGQLTLAGKRRMYSLGKYLKLKYYDLLLQGDTNKIYVRSSDSDRCLESASVLVSGLNPPTGRWVWSEEIPNWQPTAIHSMPEMDDDLLYPYAPCPAANAEEERIRNSSQYVQYLNEYKHDLQTLYDYTGNDKVFTDLTQAEIINDALKTRQGMPMEPSPVWYTSEFAKRLDYIADKTDQVKFSTPLMQRLRSGRLLHEIIQNIKIQIGSGGSTVASGEADRRNVQVYVGHDQTLIALMNSLQIYTGIPNYGSGIVIELHYDPVNLIHFLRFYMIGSDNADVVPEPVRVNPPVCGNNPECDPVQLEQNVQHLTIDKKLWLQACNPIIVPNTIVPPPSPNQEIVDITIPIEDNEIQGNSIVPNNDNPANLIVGPSIQPPPSSALPVFINEANDTASTTSLPAIQSSDSSSEQPTLDTEDDESESNEIDDQSTSEQEAAVSEQPSGEESASENPSGEPASIEPTSTVAPASSKEPQPESEILPGPSSIPPSISQTENVPATPITPINDNTTPVLISPPPPTTSITDQMVEQNKSPLIVEDSSTTNKLGPQNQIDNGIAISPMMKNLFKKNGLAATTSAGEININQRRGIRPGSVTTRDVFVPMESTDQHSGDDSKVKQPANDDFEVSNEISLE